MGREPKEFVQIKAQGVGLAARPQQQAHLQARLNSMFALTSKPWGSGQRLAAWTRANGLPGLSEGPLSGPDSTWAPDWLWAAGFVAWIRLARPGAAKLGAFQAWAGVSCDLLEQGWDQAHQSRAQDCQSRATRSRWLGSGLGSGLYDYYL